MNKNKKGSPISEPFFYDDLAGTSGPKTILRVLIRIFKKLEG